MSDKQEATKDLNVAVEAAEAAAADADRWPNEANVRRAILAELRAIRKILAAENPSQNSSEDRGQ